MKWIKKGILFNPSSQIKWAVNSALQPTPLVINENLVRMYCGMRDAEGISRVGFVEIARQDDKLIVTKVSDEPVLSIGKPGTFDDNGVVPSAIVQRGSEIFMYYAGYQIVKNVRFLVLGGLAISNDGGLTFKRYKNTPVLERTDNEFLFRVVHTVLFDKEKWCAWYGGGSHFQVEGEKSFPVYDIRYMESDDGIKFPDQGSVVLQNETKEYRVGRPFVIKSREQYLMFFGASTPDIPYRLAYATSNDGKNWERKKIDIPYASGDFDSDMSAYPSIVELQGRTYLIYNGNEYGKYGFGYAELEGDLWNW